MDGVRILVVDDDEDILEVFSEYMTLKGYKVEIATNGQQAYNIISRDTNFDLIITDLNMPVMNGIEFIKKLRFNGNYIPIIIITAFPSIKSAIDAIHFGANDYIMKPISLQEISFKVKRMIEENRVLKESMMLKDMSIFIDKIYKISLETNLHKLIVEILQFLITHTRTNGLYLFIEYFDKKFNFSINDDSEINFRISSDKKARLIDIVKLLPYINFFSTESDEYKNLEINGEKTNYFLMPIQANEEFFGGIIGYKVGNEFSNLSIQLIKMLARQIGTIFENFLLYKRMNINYISTIKALADAVDKKDKYTHFHSRNVVKIAMKIGELFDLSEEELDELQYAALLHDIGKIGVPENILNKKGKLTPEEYNIIKQHPVIGADIVSNIPSLKHLARHIRFHHERIDGKGYPDGLKGEQIPLLSKIITVADVFEAMNSNRIYRKALPIEKIRQELINVSGTQLNGDVVEKLLYLLDNNLLPELK